MNVQNVTRFPVEGSKKGRFVWGWNFDGRRRAIMATESIAEIARITTASAGYITKMGSETGNDVEVATALANPGTVLLREGHGRAAEPFTVYGTGEKVAAILPMKGHEFVVGDEPGFDMCDECFAERDRHPASKLVDCGCGTGKVTLDPKARGEGANAEHVRSEGHVAWIVARLRPTSFSLWRADARVGDSHESIESAVAEAEVIAADVPVGESILIVQIGVGVVASVSGTKHREPKDTTYQALVAGQAYRVLISGQVRLVVFSYAHVEDDDSLTLVFETATGREGWAEKLVTSIEKVDASAEATCGA